MAITKVDVVCILALWLIMWLFNLLTPPPPPPTATEPSRWPGVKNTVNAIVMIVLVIVLIAYLIR